MAERKLTQSIKGIVVSDSMSKTRVIIVERSRQHSLYKKKQGHRVKLFIHDETNKSKVGDLVIASSIRPISKNKSFRLTQILGERAG